MGIFERIRSAVEGEIPVEDDLDMGDSNRVKNLPESEDANDAVPETEAQDKADSAQSSAESYADTQVNDHSDETQDVHGVGDSDVESVSGAQSKVDDHENKDNPHSGSASTNHNNAQHSENYTTESEAEAAAPVQSVNGETGDVTVDTAGDLIIGPDSDWPDREKADVGEDSTAEVVDGPATVIAGVLGSEGSGGDEDVVIDIDNGDNEITITLKEFTVPSTNADQYQSVLPQLRCEDNISFTSPEFAPLEVDLWVLYD